MKTKTPMNLERYQKHYSERGLLAKIGKTCRKAGMKVIYYVLLLYYVLTDEKTPIKHKMVIIGALGYFILPADFIPDLLPLAGFTDDAAALLACLKAVSENVTPQVRQNAINKLHDWFDNVEYSKVEEYEDGFKES